MGEGLGLEVWGFGLTPRALGGFGTFVLAVVECVDAWASRSGVGGGGNEVEPVNAVALVGGSGGGGGREVVLVDEYRSRRPGAMEPATDAWAAAAARVCG